MENPDRPAFAETAPLPEIRHVDASTRMNGDIKRLGKLQALVVFVKERPVVGDRRAARVERERMYGVGPFVKADEEPTLQGPRQRVLATAFGAGSVDALQVEDQVVRIEVRLGGNPHRIFRN